MRLARPIVDGTGKLVAGAGTLLREGIVRILRSMAVQSVLVTDEKDLGVWETIRPLADELAELDARLGPAPSGPLAEIRDALARHLTARANRLANDPGLAGGEPEA